MLKILIYCSSQELFEKQKSLLLKYGFDSGQVVFADSGKSTREACINNNLNQWLLFLDHDCFVQPDTKKILEDIISKVATHSEEAVVYAGLYVNPKNATAFQRAHNSVANTWLTQSYADSNFSKTLLGGIFLINAMKKVTLPEDKIWGAEDKLLAKHLLQSGYRLQLYPDLAVVHHTSSRISHFVRRAYLHGANDAKFFSEKNKAKTSYWIRKIDFSDLSSALLILLHFCIQKAAKQFQKIRR